MLRLKCAVQNYEWGKPGSTSKVAQLSGAADEQAKYAELWMGTHPNAPSSLMDDKEQTLLQSVLSPVSLHPSVAAKFNGQLPFLFKVLSIAKALSIQAHPDKTLAERLHAERPQVYKDDNHKPEMAIALTEFEGLCGFRPLEEIAAALKDFPELAVVVGQDVADGFFKKTSLNETSSRKAALKSVFKSLMEAPVDRVRIQLEILVARLKSSGPHSKPSVSELVIRLDSQFPGGDVGCFCALLLNHMFLKPGEAFFMAANDPHAYLSGDCIECMATSDNVVRAGLTPKLKDVDTLVRMLTYNYGAPTIITPTPYFFNGQPTQHTKIFDPPIPEFTLMETIIKSADNKTALFSAINGPSIIVVIEGDAKFEASVVSAEAASTTNNVVLGHVYFVPALTSLNVTAGEQGIKFYRAYCEA